MFQNESYKVKVYNWINGKKILLAVGAGFTKCGAIAFSGIYRDNGYDMIEIKKIK